MATNKKSSKKSKKAKETSNNKEKKDFQWTDNESELLLNVTYDNKATKAVDNVDWKSQSYLMNHLQLRSKKE